MDTVTAERDASAAREVTVVENQWAAQVARDTLSSVFSTARPPAYQFEAPLINLRTAVDDCLGAPNLCRSTNWSAVDSKLGPFITTLYENFREEKVALRGNNDGSVESAMAAVHGQPLRARSSGNKFRARTQLPSLIGPWTQIPVALSHEAPPALCLSITLFQNPSFSLERRTFCHYIISLSQSK